MSGLMNAVARGLSSAGYAAGDAFAKQSLQEKAWDLEVEKAKRLAEFMALRQEEAEQRKVIREDQQRQAQVARIDAKADELASQQVEGTRSTIEAGIADRGLWSAEQQDAVDRSLALDKKAAKARLRTESAIATGDVSPRDAATLDNKSEIAQLRQEGVLARVQAQLDIAGDRLAMARTIAEIRATSRGDGDAKTPADQKMIEYLKSQGYKPEDAVAMVMKTDPRQQDPARMAASLATSMLSSDRFIAVRAQEAGKSAAAFAMDQAMTLIEQAEKRFNPNRQPTAAVPANTSSAPSRAAPAPAPSGLPAPAKKTSASAALGSLPAGSRQIGTSAGRPVYESPDGKRFIPQ